MRPNPKPTRNLYRLLAACFFACFIAALGLRLWGSTRSGDFVGPDHLAAGNDSVFVHFNGELLVLGAGGELRARVRTPAGIDRHSLIDLRVLHDGRLLLARRRPAGVFLCEPRSWKCSQLPLSVTNWIQDQYKVFLDERSNLLFISDCVGKLRIEPLDGGDVQQFGSGELNHPNDLALDETGRLWIADSGNHRLAVLAHKDGGWAVEHEFPAVNPIADPNHDWPMMLARATDGNWWVTQPDSFGKTAELLIYHPDKGAIARVPLPSGAYPADVAALGDGVLVSDRERFQLYRFDAFSRRAAPFGDAEVQRLLKEAQAQQARVLAVMQWSFVAIIAFAALMVVAAILATPADKRWTRVEPAAAPLRASTAAAPLNGEVYWLQRNPQVERLMRWTVPLSCVCALLLCLQAGVIYTKLHRLQPHPTPSPALSVAAGDKVLLVFGIMVFGLPFLAASALRIARPRLGTDGYRLLVKLPTDQQLALLPEQLVYDRNCIAFESHVFAVVFRQGKSLYERGEVDTYLAPLLSRATRLSHLAMLRYRLAHRDPTLVVSIAWGAGLAAALIVSGVWKLLWARLVKDAVFWG